MARDFDRSNPAQTEAVLAGLVPDEQHRRAIVLALAQVADVAAEVNPASWSITVQRNLIRLNVGSILAFEVGRELAVLAGYDGLANDSALRELVKVSEPFLIMPEVYLYKTPHGGDHFLTALQALLPDCLKVTREAAKGRGPWRRAHSPGIVPMLEHALGHSLAWEPPNAVKPTSHVAELPEWIIFDERMARSGAVKRDLGATAVVTLGNSVPVPEPGKFAYLYDVGETVLWASVEIVAIDDLKLAELALGRAVHPDARPLGLRIRGLLTPPLPGETIRQHPELVGLELQGGRPLHLGEAAAPALADLVRGQRAPRIVKIATSQGEFWAEYLRNSYIAVGWDEIGDLNRFTSKQQFKREFRSIFRESYGQSPGTIGRKANELWTLRELKPGDRVVANRGMSEVLAVGEVLPEAYVFDDARPEYKQTVRVRWDPSVAGQIQKQPYWGFTTIDDVSPELYEAIVTGDVTAPPASEGSHKNVGPNLQPLQGQPGVLAAELPPLTKAAIPLGEADGHLPGKRALGSSEGPLSTPSPPDTAGQRIPNVTIGATQPSQVDSPELAIPEQATRSVDQIAQALFSRARLVYSQETLSAFVLALQTRRFVILSGISGTGKTQLACAFAEIVSSALGVADNIAVVAVQPDWTDHHGLFGHENVLSGRYQRTATVRLIQRASVAYSMAQAEKRPPPPFFLVLDEMNLARVEHYFAPVLSAIESRQPLRLHEHVEPLDDVPSELEIPPNLCIIGTVNVDETTYMFSPKVLDRAFVLELSDIDLVSFGSRPITSQDGDLLLREAPLPLVALSRSSAEDWEQFGRMRQGALRHQVTDLHRLLGDDGRAFGYRVAGEIARFVALAEDFGCDTDAELTAALDLAILMKVLPRIHGAQQEIERLLQRLLQFACSGSIGESRGGTELLDRWRPDRGRLLSLPDGLPAKLPRSASKLYRMLLRLRQRGFAAYIE